MEVIRGIHCLKPRHKGAVATIGTFDGVHHGHKMLLDHLAAKGEELALPSMLITLEPTPREFFGDSEVPARLTRFREKIVLLSRTKLDRVLCMPFNARTRNTPAQWVIDRLLHEMLGVKYLVVGDDFRFGKGAVGDYHMLKAAGDRFGFGVSHMGTLEFEDERISSSRIRKVLAEGDFNLAEKLLGHEYFIMGRVVYGRQLGRTLGAPTANVRLQRYRAALEGVYAVTVEGLGETGRGIANIGVRPTVDGKEPLLEVHMFDFNENIYGCLISVTFKHKLREERAFESLDALKAQIHADIDTAKDWFSANGASG
ncbi:MAG: bifunctional riboflavin kinase/FAD synthetase [Pseudomonadales bacterium]|nr:bifunctional riboflavin kinase/FAD synthetase [Pseudomonadales bacterium]MDP6471574.1 bifunctional riboflavin kinase/FAD synthetase [Pseudomonadales bacterium]MDP6828837.1 bifunctional riboflavin kinase/FAD synthetase [Pseudomonadales bacterium]MDP6971721.1 bifunctional riboflavin kinase/FAD synthetase [Pseudomonadales bacterium]